MVDYEVTCVWPAEAQLGEGPVWVVEEQALYWVDIYAPAIHCLVPETGEKTTWPMPDLIGSIAPRVSGGFVAAMRSGFAFVEAGRVSPIADPPKEPSGNRFNDGKCDPQGRFWAGSMDDNMQEASGTLYRLDEDLSWRQMASGYHVPNGPAFSPDGRTMYHTDSRHKRVDVFDIDEHGDISNRRNFVTIPEGSGSPDGMTVDADGGIWIALFRSGRVVRFLPDGTEDCSFLFPATQVTSCTFGGNNLDVLYVTSATRRLDDEARRAQPLAGGLFALDVGRKGLPANQFRG